MAWWLYLLLGIYFLSCVILVTVVLLQPGKSDAAALFGGGASQTAFGPRGTMNILAYATWVSVTIMVLLALIFSVPQVFGPSSVIDGGQAPPPVGQPAPATTEQPADTESEPPADETPQDESKTGGDQNPAGAETGAGNKPQSNKN